MLSTTKIEHESGLTSRASGKSMSGFGLAWDARRGRWISLVYRYVFPRSPFLGTAGCASSDPGRRGRFAFGPCKQHHLTIGQSPFTRQQNNRQQQPRRHQSRLRSVAEEAPTSYAGFSDHDSIYEGLADDLFFSGAPASADRRGTERDREEEETRMMNEFLSSAYMDPVSGTGFGEEAGQGMAGGLVAPSSPPPPLFLESIPELAGYF